MSTLVVSIEVSQLARFLPIDTVFLVFAKKFLFLFLGNIGSLQFLLIEKVKDYLK